MGTALQHNFKEFLKLLNVPGVEYLLVDGIAVGYHGYPRVTNDLDIWAAANQANAEQIVKALKEFEFDAPELSVGLFQQEKLLVKMGTPPLRIEILMAVSGLKFSECYTARVTDQLDGIEVSVVSLEHLKVKKSRRQV